MKTLINNINFNLLLNRKKIFFNFKIIYTLNNMLIILTNNFIVIFFFNKFLGWLNKFFIFFNNYLYSPYYINYFWIVLEYFCFLIFNKILLIKVGFLKYKFFLKIGLGFKKKFLRFRNNFIIYIGNRHWLSFNLKRLNFFFNIRRKSLVIFTSTKNMLNYYLCLLRYSRKESAFKTKGIMFTRVWIRKRIPRSILFARRIRFFFVKLKLSKKQKFV